MRLRARGLFKYMLYRMHIYISRVHAFANLLLLETYMAGEQRLIDINIII